MIAVQILNELIYTLSNASPKLIDCLTKTKVLLYQIGRKDLVDWVNNEISGYQDGAELPSYRNVHAQVKVNVIAREDDTRIRRTLAMTPDISFYQYETSFKLTKAS